MKPGLRLLPPLPRGCQAEQGGVVQLRARPAARPRRLDDGKPSDHRARRHRGGRAPGRYWAPMRSHRRDPVQLHIAGTALTRRSRGSFDNW